MSALHHKCHGAWRCTDRPETRYALQARTYHAGSGGEWKAIPHVFLLIDSLAVCKFIKIQKWHKQISRSPVNKHGLWWWLTAFNARLFWLKQHWWQLRRARRYSYKLCKYNKCYNRPFSNIPESALTRQKRKCRCLNSNGLHLFPRVLWKGSVACTDSHNSIFISR